MANVLETEWYKYFELLNEAEKKSILSLLKTFLHQRTEDSAGNTIEQYNDEINESLAEVAKGNYITQEEMEKRAAGW
jgi:phosphatidylinositol kinase/protein kinase (PI-3  family)